MGSHHRRRGFRWPVPRCGPRNPLIEGIACPATIADLISMRSSHLYWANLGGTVVEANLDGSNPQTIATGQNDPYGVAVGP